MEHLKPFKIYEAEVQEAPTQTRYYKCEDRMSTADKNKMDALLEKDPKKWTDDDKKFMTKMSMKGIFYVDKDGNRYSEKELSDKGIDVDRLEGGSKERIGGPPEKEQFQRDIMEILGRSKTFVLKYKDSKDLSKVDAALQNLTSELGKLVKSNEGRTIPLPPRHPTKSSSDKCDHCDNLYQDDEVKCKNCGAPRKNKSIKNKTNPKKRWWDDAGRTGTGGDFTWGDL